MGKKKKNKKKRKTDVHFDYNPGKAFFPGKENKCYIDIVLEEKEYNSDDINFKNFDNLIENLSESTQEDFTFEDDFCGQVSEQSSSLHKAGEVTAELALNELLGRKEGALLSQQEQGNENNIPSPYTLSKIVIRKYYARVYKRTLYVLDKGKNYYIKADEDYIMGLITANLSEDYLIKIPVRFYKDAYLILLNNIGLINENVEIPCGHVLFENGMFNVLTGERVPGPPAAFCTYKVNSKYHKKYDDTPVFDAFLESVSGGNYQIKRRILEFIGYCLIPDMEGKCFFILGTASDSGKSVLGKFLKRLFGADVISNVPLEDFGKTFALAPIVGKHLNLSMDLSGGLLNKNDVSYIKQLTGEDDISMQVKYVNAFSHTNTAKFVFATNEPIHCKTDDSSFWNRMILVPFMKSIPKEEQNKNLLDDLWKERAGIVTRAIYAIRDVYDEKYVFSDCLVAERMKIQWRWHEIADVLSFVRECCDLTDSSAKTTVSELYISYRNFCDDNDIEEKEVKAFSLVLKNHFKLRSFKGEYKSHNLRGYKGIKLKSQGGDYSD